MLAFQGASFLSDIQGGLNTAFSCIKGRSLTITSLIEQPFVESDVGYHHHQEVLMINKIVFLAAVGGIALATGASALPLNPIRSDNSVDLARMVCDEYGRCRNDSAWTFSPSKRSAKPPERPGQIWVACLRPLLKRVSDPSGQEVAGEPHRRRHAMKPRHSPRSSKMVNSESRASAVATSIAAFVHVSERAAFRCGSGERHRRASLM